MTVIKLKGGGAFAHLDFSVSEKMTEREMDSLLEVPKKPSTSLLFMCKRAGSLHATVAISLNQCMAEGQKFWGCQ